MSERTNAAQPTVAELRARVTEKGPWFDVPPAAQSTLCRSCGSMVYFITTAAGKPMPVDVLVPGGVMPRHAERVNGHGLDARAGRGVSHFATCPDRDAWRKK